MCGAFSEIESLVKFFPKTTLIPGTGPLLTETGKMECVAPIYEKGNLSYLFTKETDVGNFQRAFKNGLDYIRGDSSKNFFIKDGKKITVEICSDHGKQEVAEDTFLEIILADDRKAGFYLRANNDSFSRYAFVCDGFAPKLECFKFIHNPYGLSFVDEKILKKDSLYLYELNKEG